MTNDTSIAFDSVSFAYPVAGARRTKTCLPIAAGERVGIVGPSGSGKSTIVRLLLRLHDPESGTICIGGQDLRALDPEAVRRMIAVVAQDTYLFHGTIEDNLRLGCPEASEADLVAAARAANAHDFIESLPEGYHTVIGERGARLSGGQRQRIAIARALLRDAPILVLDEALSSVDAENEAVIQQALERLMAGLEFDADTGASPVQRNQRRPHSGAAGRCGGAKRQPRRADRAGWPVSRADGAAAWRAPRRGPCAAAAGYPRRPRGPR